MTSLPQPNYSAYFGKGELDIHTLERLDYVVDEQRIWLRTLHEADGSSLCDEGYVAFRRRPDGGTRIAVLACVYFPMPRLLVATHLQSG